MIIFFYETPISEGLKDLTITGLMNPNGTGRNMHVLHELLG